VSAEEEKRLARNARALARYYEVVKADPVLYARRNATARASRARARAYNVARGLRADGTPRTGRLAAENEATHQPKEG
jgi:hypothetical protein